MIKYILKCNNNHEFESWFANSSEFENLKNKKLLECIYCSSKKINKSIMAPMLSVAKENEFEFKRLEKESKTEKQKLIKLRQYIEKNFEFVGNKLSEKVRAIYYDKESKKSVYGTATKEERQELADEGIDLLSIPWVSKDN